MRSDLWSVRGSLMAIAMAVCIAVVGARVLDANWPQQAATTSTRSGVYTDAQAARGETTYANNCMGCHTTATYTAPSFRNSWNGASVWDLYSYIREMMPEDAPGALTDAEYAQVVAYFLKLNRAPTGKTDLTTDGNVLKTIRIEIGSHPAPATKH